DGNCIDERPFARKAAEAFGVHNYDVTITAQEFWHFLPKYVWHMEEPVCEPPAIALYYVSKFAREHVTVLLSGEGGDEAFAGYQSYRTFSWLETIKRILGPLAGALSTSIPSYDNGNGISRLRQYGRLISTQLGEYYYSHSSGTYEFFNSHYEQLYTPDFLHTVQKSMSSELTQQYFAAVRKLTPLDQMLYVDTKTW